MTRVAVLGAGSWGTVLAAVLGDSGCRVALWARSPEAAARLQVERRDARAAPALVLPASVSPTAEVDVALDAAEIVLFVVPTGAMREVAGRAGPSISAGAMVVSCAKGFEPDSRLRMTEVLAAAAPALEGRITALSGPNLAGEIAEGHPAAAVVAGSNPEATLAVQAALSSTRLRLYTNGDVVGVEYGGALKNCIAIAAGVADGLAMGVNGRSALVARGLAEIARLGVAAGAQALTFSGLAGLGDLIATCTSPRSRNYQVGVNLAAGRSLPEIARLLGHVAEGVNTTAVARSLAADYHVRTPVIDGVYEVLYRQRPVQEVLHELMAGPPGDEFADLLGSGR
jgi:glycerol-3-phosphate dehydrogenase (NAD(P)+)